MRKSSVAFLPALLLAAIFPAAAPLAAGNYSENFDDNQAQSWSTLNGAWTATGGYYTNTNSQVERSIAFYGGTTWLTGFTYNVRMYSDWAATGNQVGAVFNYQNDDNYYEVLFNMAGTATLNRVIDGTRITVASAAYTSPGKDTWFNVQIARSGTNTTIRVNGAVVLSNIAQPELGAGRIGVLTRWNFGRFDAVSVVDSAAGTTRYLFRSGFGPGVILTPKECRGDWYQNLNGGDVAGFTWPQSFWGPAANPVFQSTVPCSYTYEEFVRIQLKTVVGPTGINSRVLSNTVLSKRNDWLPNGGTGARSGVGYRFAGTPASSYYIRRYLKYPSNLITQMGNHGWFVQHEYKTNCEAILPGRMAILWQKDGQGVPYYRLLRDANVNCSGLTAPVWNETCYPNSGQCPAMPVGRWFYDELYVRYPTSGNSGTVKYALNRQMVFDHTTRSGEPLPSLPNRMKITPGYLNFINMEIMVDDLEVLTEPPCGTFPCGAPAHIAE